MDWSMSNQVKYESLSEVLVIEWNISHQVKYESLE